MLITCATEIWPLRVDGVEAETAPVIKTADRAATAVARGRRIIEELLWLLSLNIVMHIKIIVKR
jgi:hypothetical protein